MAQHSTHQDAPHRVHGARVLVVGCPVEWDLAFRVRNPDVGVVLDEQLRVLRVVVVGAPVQSRLLQEEGRLGASVACSVGTSTTDSKVGESAGPSGR